MASWFDLAGFGFQEFSAGGIRTFAIVEGRTGGFPLVLLHSVPGASFIWSTTIQSVGRSRRILAPDYPGWGRSHNRVLPQKFTLTRDGLRKWLAEVMRAQQFEQCDVVGIGDGAWLALDYLFTEPDKVRRLGLLNLPVKRTIDTKRLLPWCKTGWDKRNLDRWMNRESGLSNTNRRLVEPLFGELLAGGWHAERSPEFPAGEYRTALAGYRDCLRKFDGEVLLGWGANAPGYDEVLAAEIAKGRTIVVWHEAANFPMWEQPERYSNEITDFLRS